MDDDVLTVRILLQNDEYVKTLEQGLVNANERASHWEKRCKKLELEYARASHFNLELIDLLKANGIRYRPCLDGGTWEKSK
jgi:hypothetical protein